MKDKNLLDDIKNKSLNELTELANNIIEKLENEKNLELLINDYQKLIKLNNLIAFLNEMFAVIFAVFVPMFDVLVVMLLYHMKVQLEVSQVPRELHGRA